jgi:hypothetical protein
MFLSKLQIRLFAIFAAAIIICLAWGIRETAKLRSEAARRAQSGAATVAALEQQVTVETRRVATAEAKVAKLMEVAKATVPTARQQTGAAAQIDAADAVKGALARASRLIKENKFQEALDVYLPSYRELEAIRPGSSECQSLMNAIKALGRNYPAAQTALAGLRDSAMAEFQTPSSRKDLPFEIALLNDNLGQGSLTLAVYDSLPANDPGRQGLAMIANSSFIEAQRYSDALLGKPFGKMVNLVDVGAKEMANPTGPYKTELRQLIVDGTLTNIEILTGAGKLEDARLLTEKFLAFDSSDAIRAAIKQHVDRALAVKPQP